MNARLTIQRLGESSVQVAGRIDIGNAASALARSPEVAMPGRRVEVDLAQLESADSVTLSVLLAWAARARRAQGSLAFVSPPSRLLAIAHLSKAEPLLGFANAA